MHYTVNVNRLRRNFVENAIGIERDFANIIFANFGRYFATLREFQECLGFANDVLRSALSPSQYNRKSLSGRRVRGETKLLPLIHLSF